MPSSLSTRSGLFVALILISFTIFYLFTSSSPSNSNTNVIGTEPRKSPSSSSAEDFNLSPPSSPSSNNNKKKSNNNNLMPEFADELFNMSSELSRLEKVPPFLVRPAKRGNDLKIRWKCAPRKIGPFHVDSPTTPWPTCRMLDHDTDMKTFQYFTERLMCGLPVFGSQSEKWVEATNKVVSSSASENNNNNNNNQDALSSPSISTSSSSSSLLSTSTGLNFDEILQTYKRMESQNKQIEDDDASLKSHRPLRVLQVGANTGSNQNDPLVKLLMGGYAQAVLLEPVPWIFEKLHETYGTMAGMISLVQAAVSSKDGSTTFMAPKPSMSVRGPWLHQMGGLNLPPRSVARLKRMGLLKEFKQITVASLTITTILNKFAPWVEKEDANNIGALPPPPDVIVIDAEGFDAVIVNQVLDYVHLLDEAGRSNEDGETVSIIQYENKHVPKRDNARLMQRLTKMGYTVTEVYVDTVAVRTGRGAFYQNVKGGVASPEELAKRWPACDHGFSLERR